MTFFSLTTFIKTDHTTNVPSLLIVLLSTFDFRSKQGSRNGNCHPETKHTEGNC